MLLSKLFLNCYNGINYQTAGDSVNYAFVRWAKRVEKKVNDLVDTFYIASMKNDNNDTK